MNCNVCNDNIDDTLTHDTDNHGLICYLCYSELGY
jgi:hypothetical protein